MKKYAAVMCVVMLCLSALSGCERKRLPELPDDAVAFEAGTFTDTEHDGDSFAAIEYGGRTYIAYGTINNRFRYRFIESCAGYIIQDENISSVTDPNNTNRRIYTLSGDPDRNFLMDHDDTVGLMNQPVFLRATDTKGKDTDIPEYIDPLGHEFWGERQIPVS